ncbi:hypothetical protein K445DRAFT_13551 [Daldinia sp. EC12]|nr:hypothetical protein K445DRAFT_13551 [Daldinia sp. EC12]
MARPLPIETLTMIFTDEGLCSNDLKSLRLTQRQWEDVATNLLFKRVCVSRLKKDRDAFFNIASSPHLAQAARILIWYELPNDIPDWLGNASSPNTAYQELEDPAASIIFNDLYSQVGDLFWCSFQRGLFRSGGFNGTAQEMVKLDEFMAQF